MTRLEGPFCYRALYPRRPLGTLFPPAVTPLHLPLLRDSIYGGVDAQLRRATGAMRGIGLDEYGGDHHAPVFWEGLGPRRQWPSNVPFVADPRRRISFEDDIFKPRAAAARSVAQELEFHVPQFRGLTQKIEYAPWFHVLDRYDAGTTDMGNGRVRLGSLAFESPGRLAQVLMHEGRHYQQWRDFGPASSYTRPNTLAEADAYLFDLEHRNLSQLGRASTAFTMRQFRSNCDVNDRLAAGRWVDPAWRVTEMMDPVRRADLELRYSFIEPSLRRDLAGSRYAPLWQTMPPTFSYQPLRPWAQGPSLFQQLSQGLR